MIDYALALAACQPIERPIWAPKDWRKHRGGGSTKHPSTTYKRMLKRRKKKGYR